MSPTISGDSYRRKAVTPPQYCDIVVSERQSKRNGKGRQSYLVSDEVKL